MAEKNYIMTVGFLDAEYNQLWDDSETYQWEEFDYKMLQTKGDSNYELLNGLQQSDFSSISTIKTDVIFAVFSTPFLGIIAKNQTILGTDIIRRIPTWIFGVASVIACYFRISAIIDNNRELLQLNNNAVKFLRFLEKLPRFDEFKETEYFQDILKIKGGMLKLLDFGVVEEFYIFRNKEKAITG